MICVCGCEIIWFERIVKFHWLNLNYFKFYDFRLDNLSRRQIRTGLRQEITHDVVCEVAQTKSNNNFEQTATSVIIIINTPHQQACVETQKERFMCVCSSLPHRSEEFPLFSTPAPAQ